MKRILLVLLLAVAAVFAPLAQLTRVAQAQANIIYVNEHTPAQVEDGMSWETAYSNLQAALSFAQPGDQIWVAAGTYLPDIDLAGQRTYHRASTFLIPDGVAVYGGFAGTETSLAQRNWRANPSILTGDLLGNDSGTTAFYDPNRQDNAYHVVSVVDASESTLLDGFIIKGGNANGNGADGFGGGLYAELTLARFANLDLYRNSAANGGGMYAFEYSGSMANIRFLGNQAGMGGGLMAWYSPLRLQNAVYSGNAAEYQCSAMINGYNSAAILVNSTFANNTAVNGAAICNFETSTLWIRNSIFDYNQSIVDEDTSSHSLISYSVIRDPSTWWLDAVVANGGSLYSVQAGANPQLAHPAGNDYIPGTLDDNLAPLSGSPAENAGDAGSLQADATDLDWDGNTGEPAPLDLVGRPRTLGTQPDAGAYELSAVPLVTISANVGVTYFEDPVTLTVQVTSPSSTPTGKVTFFRGAQELATVPLDGSTAVYKVYGLNAGLHTFHARYNGDANHRASVAQPIEKFVEPIEVTVSVTADRNTALVGQPVTFSAQVQPEMPVQTPHTGTVRIRDAAENNLCSYSYPAEAGCAYGFPDPGEQSYHAVFQSATSNFVNTASPEGTVTVSMAETNLEITGFSPSAAVRAGQPVAVSFALAAQAPGAAPLEGTVTIASAEEPTAACSVPAADGPCQITFTTLGIHTLTAEYSGSTRLNGSTSGPVSYRVRGEDAYVDDDGLCNTNYPCFTSIAEGIADVNPGHSVFVYRGTYPGIALEKDVTVVVDDDVEILGDVTVDAGTLNITPFGRFTVQGDFVRGGTGAITAAGPVTLNGAGDQRLGVGQLTDLALRDGALMAYWTMDEDEGGTVFDVTGGGNHFFNAAAAHAGAPGPLTFSRDVLNFTGQTIPLYALMDVPETEATVSFWFRTEQADAGLFEIANGVVDYTGFDRSIFLRDGEVCAYLWGTGETSETICSTGADFADGQWHHVAHAYGASIGGQRLYLDGALQASGTRSASDFSAQKYLLLGQSQMASANQRAAAQVDDLRLYRRALGAGNAYLLASGSPAVKTVALKNDTAINGNFFLVFANLDVADPDTVEIISHDVTLKGNWMNHYGALDAREGTVTLNGTVQAVYGDNTFYNLTRRGAGSLTFSSGDLQTVLGTLTLSSGDPGVWLPLDRMGAENWLIDARGPVALEYLTVSHSTNVGAERIDATGGGNIRGEGTTGWNFYAPQFGGLRFNAVEEQETALNLSAADGDADPVTLTVVSLPAHGTLYHTTADGARGAAVQAGDTLARPALIYTFTTDGPASVTFDLTASDGQAATTATAALALTSVNDSPVAVDDAYETDEESALIVQAANGVLANDTDEETASLSAAIEVRPVHGHVEMLPGGGFMYAPNIDFNGTDTFTYRASDGARSATATVTITVNPEDDLPVARLVDAPTNVVEGERASFAVALIDPDDGSTVPFSAGAQITWDFGDGQTGSGATVQVTYPDNHDALVVDARVEDAASGISATVSTMIQVLNAPPEITDPGPLAATERFALVQEITFADPGLADTWTVTVDYGDGSEPQTLDAVDGKFTLSHTYATAGSYQITIVVADDDGGQHTLVAPVTVATAHVLFTPIITR